MGPLKLRAHHERRFAVQSSVAASTCQPWLRFRAFKKVGIQIVRLNIETKIGPPDPKVFPAPALFARTVLYIICAHDLVDRVTLQSFDWRTLR